MKVWHKLDFKIKREKKEELVYILTIVCSGVPPLPITEHT